MAKRRGLVWIGTPELENRQAVTTSSLAFFRRYEPALFGAAKLILREVVAGRETLRECAQPLSHCGQRLDFLVDRIAGLLRVAGLAVSNPHQQRDLFLHSANTFPERGLGDAFLRCNQAVHAE